MLEFEYGSDWRVAKQDWDYMTSPVCMTEESRTNWGIAQVFWSACFTLPVGLQRMFASLVRATRIWVRQSAILSSTPDWFWDLLLKFDTIAKRIQ